MSDIKKLSVGKELTDDELMEMTGGANFSNGCENISIKPINHALYGIPPKVVPKYGIPVNIKPLYGIIPDIKALYGINPS